MKKLASRVVQTVAGVFIFLAVQFAWPSERTKR
jgi:hypothetical protein